MIYDCEICEAIAASVFVVDYPVYMQTKINVIVHFLIVNVKPRFCYFLNVNII